MIRLLFMIIIALSFSACATTAKPPLHKTYTASMLQQGKRYFETGFYRKAMRELLPLACDGSAEAQYAVGYMYYYGYGVTQDTEVGRFWIQRSADQGYLPAIQGLTLIKSPFPTRRATFTSVQKETTIPQNN